MPTKTLRGKDECSSCGRLFTSWRRLQQHRAAEHAPKTSEDIRRRAAVKGITELAGLHDIRTVISTHARSASRHKGTPYLEMMSLSMEKLRLEAELARLTKFRTRVEGRLSGIRVLMEERVNMVLGEDPAGNDAPDERTSGNRAQKDAPTPPRDWRTMKVGY